MGKIKKTFLMVVAVVISVLTLKKFRSKGSDTEDEEQSE